MRRVWFDNPVLDALLLSIYVSDEPIDHSLMATAERLGVSSPAAIRLSAMPWRRQQSG